MTQKGSNAKEKDYIEVRVPKEMAELLLKLLEAIEKNKVKILREDSEGNSHG